MNKAIIFLIALCITSCGQTFGMNIEIETETEVPILDFSARQARKNERLRKLELSRIRVEQEQEEQVIGSEPESDDTSETESDDENEEQVSVVLANAMPKIPKLNLSRIPRIRREEIMRGDARIRHEEIVKKVEILLEDIKQKLKTNYWAKEISGPFFVKTIDLEIIQRELQKKYLMRLAIIDRLKWYDHWDKEIEKIKSEVIDK